MNPNALKKLLNDLKDGKIGVDGAMERLKKLPFEKLKHSTVDHHRALRQGYAEVVFCQGKEPREIADIARRICASGHNLLATRASDEIYDILRTEYKNVNYNRRAKTLIIENRKALKKTGMVAVVSAGTSDGPVAEEAAVTAEFMGSKVERHYDVGVAGLHRLIGILDDLNRASVIVVAAGMEGALPSVVGGLVEKPVIAVPTSVGYGASFGGIAALLGMLNSCASGVTVVNIDNGFGAGYAAALINRKSKRAVRFAADESGQLTA
jgi:NCAIR mutase (PurE)-related protein